jgi:nitrogen fixation NifU-like protein
MSDTLNSFIDSLQATIDRETEEQFGETFLNRLRNLTYTQMPGNASSTACLTGSCGDRMCIALDIEGDRIRSVGFETTGCGPSQVCGSVACELADGKSLEEAAGVDGSDVLGLLGGLPEEHQHCAYLAAETLREAIKQFWKACDGQNEKS